MASWISKKARLAIYKRDACTCIYCEKQCVVGDTKDGNIQKGDLATLDHIVSQKELAELASDDKDFSAKRRNPKNLVVSCMSCNSKKQARSLYAFCGQQGIDYAAVLMEIGRRIALPV